MATLANYPNLDQKQVPVNGQLDCVPTSLTDGLEFLTGKKYAVYDVVTAAYGANYRGFTSAVKFIAFCASQGVKLFPIDGDGPALAAAVHAQIQQGHPCLGTEPDVYALAHPDWSHVISFYREDPGTLTARDPYSVEDVTHTDAEWARLFEFREIWAMEKIAPPALVLPANWSDDSHTLSTPTGKAVLGFRQEILNLLHAGKWDADDFIIGEQFYNPQLELSNTALGPGDQLITNKHLLAYPHDPQGSVAHLKNTVVIEYVGKELDACRRKLLEYQARLNQPQPIALPQDEAAITQFLAQVGPLHGWKQA